MLSRFHTIPACYGQTHGQTDRVTISISRVSLLTRDKNIGKTVECCQLLDFGLAREVDFMMTGYVITRWYRAPEVILNYKRYTQAGLCCL